MKAARHPGGWASELPTVDDLKDEAKPYRKMVMETITKVNASDIDERLEVPSRRSSTVLWRLNNKSANVRQQAADLTTRLAVMIKQCGEVQLLSTLGLVLFE
ncbi:hypothetical protein K503DRAFT_805347 [Rhizopogon vinicolor AM-OR11-026]|uniref:Uncharacterized protein n=1 Tax=Rhizopogon vinicolor AM-OR11-026 TaxID=1314800 RepID=A0A1B7MI53_9AGAM|nr:hypothetical protein K503DRAFT_805347 [Rhizopogon vinicolor AM-OR11-026]